MKKFALLLILFPAIASAQLKLSEAEATAWRLNPLVDAAKSDVDAARANARAMLAPWNPMLTFGAGAAAGNSEPLFMFEGLGASFAMAPPAGAQAINATLMWRIWSGGRKDTSAQLGLVEIAMASARRRMTLLELQEEVRMEFAKGVMLQDEIENLQDMLKAAREMEEVTIRMVEAGKLPAAFQFGAKADRLGVEQEIALMEADLKAALEGVAACCGADIIGGKLGDWDSDMPVPESLEAALELAFARSPEIQMATAEAKMFELKAKLANQSGLPEISFMGSSDKVWGDPMMFKSGSQASLLVSIPLIDGGMRRNEAAAARHMKSQSEGKALNARNLVRVATTSAWAMWTASAKALEASEAQIEAAAEGFRVAKLRYEEGKSIRAEVSEALADLREAHSKKSRATMIRREAWAKLMHAIAAPTPLEEGPTS